MARAVPEAAFELATRRGFDCLHDPNPATSLIEPYHDPVGYPTQGYGRLLSRARWDDLRKYPAVTVAQARADLEVDLARAGRAVERLILVDLTEGQFSALVDFAFNCGAGNLQVSSLRRVLNRGGYDEVPDQLKRWVYAGSVKLPGLVRRRTAEAELFSA